MIIPDNRITPENITELLPNQVFVFGSNRAGRHGRGAAKTALKWGAKMGQGEGLMGQTYGLPTKDRNIQTLSPLEINYAVTRYLKFALQHPELEFLTTAVGTGLARYSPRDIAMLFGPANLVPANVRLPKSFWDVLTKAKT